MKKLLRDIGITLAMAIAIFLLLQFTVQSFVVVGYSMQPNLQEGERLMINKLVYRFREPARGEVIVFLPPSGHQPDYIKRIIGLPGDTVEVKEGTVYINGSPLDEPYVNEPPKYTLSERTVLDNEYFVLGDNRNNSNDSHNGWTVPEDNIVGKAWLTFWPLSEWGTVPDYFSEENS